MKATKITHFARQKKNHTAIVSLHRADHHLQISDSQIAISLCLDFGKANSFDHFLAYNRFYMLYITRTRSYVVVDREEGKPALLQGHPISNDH